MTEEDVRRIVREEITKSSDERRMLTKEIIQFLREELSSFEMADLYSL